MTVELPNGGSVEFISAHGNDLAVVNAARVSMGKWKDEMDESDVKLIKYLAKNKHHCYDSETQVFTDRGWVYWPDVTSADLLAAVNPDDMTMKMEHPISLYESHYEGKMLLIEHRDASLCVTPNHRMFVSRRSTNGIFKAFEVQDALSTYRKSYRLASGAVFHGNNQGTYDEGYLYGFYLGDGYRESSRSISFHLKKQRKIDSLIVVLNKLGSDYNIRDGTHGSVVVRVSCDDMKFNGTSSTKCISESVFAMGHEYRMGVLQGMLDTDGSVKRGAYTFASTSSVMVEDFVRLCTTLGMYCKYNKSFSPDNENHNTLYKAMLLSRSTSPRINDPSTSYNDAWVDYSGFIYCATVSTGLMLVRRNGKICVSGNSPFRHCSVTMRLRMSVVTERQFTKHRFGVEINSISGRYVQFDETYHMPDVLRQGSASIKQGSLDEPVYCHDTALEIYKKACESAFESYKLLLHLGVCKEQARMVLPLSLMTEMICTMSLQAAVHFYNLRADSHAQREIQGYAHAIADIFRMHYPVSWDALTS